MLIGNVPHSRISERVLSLDKQFQVYVQIFSRYDLIVCTGIQDLTEFQGEMDALQKSNGNYDFYVSPVLTKLETVHPDRYAFIYRKDVVKVSDYVRDTLVGALSARVKVISTGQEFALSIVHLTATRVVKELELLPGTCESVRKTYNLENILVTGDFNTIERFISEEDFNKAAVTKDPLYKWFIQWSENTIAVTFAKGSVNKFLAVGDIKNWVEPDSAKVFDTKTAYKLTDEEATGMSALFPTELKLK